MSELANAVGKFKRQHEPRREVISGWMADPEGYGDPIVRDETTGIRTGYYYCMIDRGDGTNSGDFIKAWGGGIRPVAGWPVLIGTTRERPWELSILSIDKEAMGGAIDRYSQVTEAHHETHEWGDPSGSDDVVYPRFLQLYDFSVWPVPETQAVTIADGVYDPLATRIDFPYTTKDLSADAPSGLDTSRWIIVALDPSGVVQTYACPSGTNQGIEDICQVPYSNWWELAAVKLWQGDSSINMVPGAEEVIDLRFSRIGFPRTGGGAGPGVSWGNVIVVAKSGGDYPTIAEGIAAAVAGDCVLIMPGEYAEDFTIDKAITLAGLSKEDVIITGADSGTTIIYNTADNAYIQDLTIFWNATPTAASMTGIYSTQELHINRVDVYVDAISKTGAGVYANTDTISAQGCNIYGYGDVDGTAGAVNTGTLNAYWCAFWSEDYDLANTAGTINIYFCQYDPAKITGVISHGESQETLIYDLTLDDGAGDSPSLKFVGGSNNDTIEVFLEDNVVANDSDIIIKLCAADDDSRVIIRDSLDNDRAYIDSDGNAQFDGQMGVGASVDPDRAVNVFMTTSGASNTEGIYAQITTAPAGNIATNHYGLYFLSRYWNSFNCTGTLIGIRGEVDVRNGQTPTINLALGVQFLVDSKDSTITMAEGARIYTPYVDEGIVITGRGLRIRQGAVGTGSITTLYGLYIDAINAGGTNFAIYSAGGDSYHAGQIRVGGAAAVSAQLHVDQAVDSAAIPVLYLDQADISEEMIQFETTIGVGNAIEAVGAKTLTATHFIKVTLPGGLTRYIPAGTIA